MTSSPSGPRRAMVTLAAVVALAGLVGCGGGAGDDAGAPTGPVATAPSTTPGAATAPTTAVRGTAPGTATTGSGGSSFGQLAAAVCRVEVAEVPPVPDPEKAAAAERRRYVRAVEEAAGGLASAFVALERRRPESQATLQPLVVRAREVERTARAAVRGATGESGDVRTAIARLNEATSAARLPACAL